MKNEHELDIEILAIATEMGRRHNGHPDETIGDVTTRAVAAGDPVAIASMQSPPSGLSRLALKEWAISNLRAAMTPERQRAVDQIVQEMRDPSGLPQRRARRRSVRRHQ